MPDEIPTQTERQLVRGSRRVAQQRRQLAHLAGGPRHADVNSRSCNTTRPLPTFSPPAPAPSCADLEARAHAHVAGLAVPPDRGGRRCRGQQAAAGRLRGELQGEEGAVWEWGKLVFPTLWCCTCCSCCPLLLLAVVFCQTGVHCVVIGAHQPPPPLAPPPSRPWATGGGGGGVWVGRWQPVQVHHYHDTGAKVLP